MPQITLYGADTCRFTNRTRGQLDSLGVQYTYIDLHQDRKEDVRIRQLCGRNSTPIIEIVTDAKTHRLVRPSDWQLDHGQIETLAFLILSSPVWSLR